MRRTLINILSLVVCAVLFLCLLAVIAALDAQDWVADRLRLESERRHEFRPPHTYKSLVGHGLEINQYLTPSLYEKMWEKCLCLIEGWVCLKYGFPKKLVEKEVLTRLPRDKWRDLGTKISESKWRA